MVFGEGVWFFCLFFFVLVWGFLFFNFGREEEGSSNIQ